MWSHYSEGLDPEASYFAISEAEGTVAAFSLVTSNAWDGRSLLVTETPQRDQPDGTARVASASAATFAVLRERGVTRVEIEGHPTEPHVSSLTADLPDQGGDPMDVLRLDRPTTGTR